MVIRIKKSSHVGFISLLTLLSALLFLRYSFNIEIPRIILTAVIIVIALIGSPNEILAISLCCIPLHEAIDFYIALVACAIVLVVKTSRLMRSSIAIILGVTVVLWEALHCLQTDVSIMSFLVSVIPMAFLIMIMHCDVSEVDYPFIVRSLTFVSAIISMVILVNHLAQADFNFVNGVLSIQRLGQFSEDEVLLGGRLNPNAIGIINVLGITALLQLRFIDQHRKSDYFIAIVLIIFGVLTASKTFFICLLLMIFLLFLGQVGNAYQKVRFTFIVLVVALVAWVLLNLLFPSTLEYFISRFQVADLSTGRNQLMIKYNDFISSHPSILLFGIGAADMPNKVTGIYNIANNVPHNSIQEIIIAWGLFGLLLIAFLIAIMIMEAKRYGRRKILLNFIPLIIIFTKSLAGQLITSRYSMLMLVLAYLSLCQNFKVTDQIN